MNATEILKQLEDISETTRVMLGTMKDEVRNPSPPEETWVVTLLNGYVNNTDMCIRNIKFLINR